MAMRSGLPAMSKFDGIPFTFEYPKQQEEEITNTMNESYQFIFGKDNAIGGGGTPGNNNNNNENEFPNDVLLVITLPRILLKPLKGYENDQNKFCCLPFQVLKAMYPMHPSGVLDIKPWSNGMVMLPPTCILRGYQLVEKKKDENNDRIDSNLENNNISHRSGSRRGKMMSVDRVSVESFKLMNSFKQQLIIDEQVKSSQLSPSSSSSSSSSSSFSSPPSFSSYSFSSFSPMIQLGVMKEDRSVIEVNIIDDYLNKMKLVHKKANNNNLIPLYHYTSRSILHLIIKGGLRMSSQGQGDGGVYFSLKGPLSYNLGSKNYEKNLIKDCFGVERVDEYLGKGKLDAVIVYGCEADVLVQAPGGRDNAKMIPKSYFNSLSLPQTDGNYFLRPDRILAIFLTKSNLKILRSSINNSIRTECDTQLKIEQENSKVLSHQYLVADSNARKIVKLTSTHNGMNENEEEEEEEDDDDDENEVNFEESPLFKPQLSTTIDVVEMTKLHDSCV
eukprot:CAMPEP_0114355496 /NCGR_PEP_ID=MMETSP0101-20121206/20260_1 /TAXON_ID=38822 ORGANISM="Pteridomonas danica, Strain PT" /NCGR_SAMPLE_ID=MMETSP0101 /ASSEMBLY_ACC=CAM_ASM_000211 /LENGTH=501 /DNA_ID=CAMNT_0001497467 /DNA_START=467 /DNA_END=1972 /DNA_ORIENTATION=+